MTAIDARVAAAVAGDRKAIESLVTELLPRIRNLVRYLVRGDNDADDLAQEALVAIVRGLPTHRGEGSFNAWADRVAVRCTFAGLRKARRARAQLDASADLASVPHPDGPPDEYAARRATVRMLDQIPDEQRQNPALFLSHGMHVRRLGSPVS
jgi:RNA polymerase sigma-70 factor (ECF subfamily)